MAEEAVDPSSLLALRRLQAPGARDAVARILSRFFAESEERLVALRRAAQMQDAQAIERSAHALKGIAGTVGAHEVSNLALRLEQGGRVGRIQEAAVLVNELESALGRARAVFERVIADADASGPVT